MPSFITLVFCPVFTYMYSSFVPDEYDFITYVSKTTMLLNKYGHNAVEHILTQSCIPVMHYNSFLRIPTSGSVLSILNLTPLTSFSMEHIQKIVELYNCPHVYIHVPFYMYLSLTVLHASNHFQVIWPHNW